ncbi:MAG: helix-turn-helix transcriptional regulator [Candidatus Helarchaeota archaeon]
MWLSKFLDLEELELENMKELAQRLIKELEKKKLTPLEFSILGIIFNAKMITTRDIIVTLNKQFTNSWEAKEGTIKPILSKLKKRGFLGKRKVSSPLGPLKKVHYLTDAGEEILKAKVSQNFQNQLKFIEIFLIELAIAYIRSVPRVKQPERGQDVQNILDTSWKFIKSAINQNIILGNKCPSCGEEITREDAKFCLLCGAPLMSLLKLE